MVERKRRERMNNSIAQLKSLIAQTIKHNTAPMTRVDKADILELTVYHLTQIHQQQQSVAMAAEVAAYTAGYKECAREAVTYLSNCRTPAAVSGSLSNHLHSSMLANNSCLHNSQRTNALSQLKRHSTPLRPCDSLNPSLPDLNVYGYTPIQNDDQSSPEVTLSFDYASVTSGSSIDLSSSCSSSDESHKSCTHYSINDVRREQDLSGTDKSTDVVTIGIGRENEIGHVIKEIPWRPF
ncbi:transcription factor HES-4-like [Mercenaria mercenaria]|uniref:transcription factor HES-4-like n=1 Tax=Mercenaria mercenaria TaxID=6596 RepID=UPI00234E4D17|nr:transcription factor HES-4-like [Mercenaria mercenaria]